jgi:Tfp pilus assembly protein PilO
VTLRAEFEDKQGRAANLEPLKQQLAQMELMLQQMLRQLPSKNEMPDLIVDVSQTALASGISNELFQPARKRRKSSTPRSRSTCAWSAPTTSSAPSSAASPRCRASSS